MRRWASAVDVPQRARRADHVVEKQAELLDIGGVGGQRVGGARGLEVEGVPGALAEPVRALERGGIFGIEEPGGLQPVERVDRLGYAQVRVVATVHELEELHGELDVRQ
jgi:hypothetical protein